MKIEIPDFWRAAIGAEFDKPYFKSLAKFVDDERQAFPLQIYPAQEQVFAALQLTPYDRVSVLLLGQDPYPGEGMAHGLCFSVSPTVKKLPASLKNMFRELRERPKLSASQQRMPDGLGEARRPDAQHDSDAEGRRTPFTQGPGLGNVHR